MSDTLLESIKNFVLNNMGNRECMHLTNLIISKEQELTKLRACLKEAANVIGFYAKGMATRIDKHDYSNVFVDEMGPFNITGHKAREFQTKYADILADVNKERG